MTDLITGPVKENPKAPLYTKPQRKVELYHGEPPQGEKGIMTEFTLTKECGIEDKDPKTDKKYNCPEKLHVIRVKNTKFKRDKTGYSGQLEYDAEDQRQYVFCPSHGPSQIPESW